MEGDGKWIEPRSNVTVELGVDILSAKVVIELQVNPGQDVHHLRKAPFDPRSAVVQSLAEIVSNITH